MTSVGHTFGVCVALLCVAANAPKYDFLKAGLHAVRNKAAIRTIGTGRYAYRFTLKRSGSNLAWPNHSYALTVKGHELPFVGNEKDVYSGVTDEKGHTAVFRMDAKIADSFWTIRERFGSGPFGETFHITDEVTGGPIAYRPYLIVVCANPLQYYRGRSDELGYTAYVATPKEQKLQFYYGSLDYNDDSSLPKSCAEHDDGYGASDPDPSGAVPPVAMPKR
jgi:hypothetical protein